MSDFIWSTITSFPFFILSIIKCAVPLMVYLSDIKLLRLCFLQIQAILLFMGVIFSLISRLVLFSPKDDLPIDFNFFLLQKACLANFLLVNCTISFLTVSFFQFCGKLLQHSMSHQHQYWKRQKQNFPLMNFALQSEEYVISRYCSF